jgi:hypothetical protein
MDVLGLRPWPPSALSIGRLGEQYRLLFVLGLAEARLRPTAEGRQPLSTLLS